MPKSNGNRVEMIGSEMDLQKGPDDMRRNAFPGGMVQMVGSEAVMVHQTTPMGVFDKGVRGGSQEWTGSTVDLDKTPHRGWDSYPTPISDNSTPPERSTSSYPGSGNGAMRIKE